MPQQVMSKIKYDDIAGKYDVVDLVIPSKWRHRAASLTYGRVLEVGIGTGLNIPFYPNHCQEIIGIDVSAPMLGQAAERVPLSKVPVKLQAMDVQNLLLPAGSFDCVLATFVFCTVPDPFQGLRECHRVLKPGGNLVLLEHMGSENRQLRQVMNWLNPLTVRLLGDHINRDTVKLVAAAGFRTQIVENLFGDVVRLVVAGK